MALNIRNPEAFARKPAAVIFDTDNTLYDYAPAHAAASAAAREKAQALLGVDGDAFDDAYRAARKEVKARLGHVAASHSRLLYFQRMIERLGLKTQLLHTLDLNQTYWRTFLGASTLFPDARALLEDLRALSIHTAIVTDLTAEIQFRKIVYFDLADHFDYVVTSEEAGADKPDLAPFQLALEKLGLQAGEVWMVGDNAVNDIQGARALGIPCWQKLHTGVSEGQGEQAADGTFTHFGEMRKFISVKF
ncbi:HAD family hydrolase [Magnetofaba australis]|uniref:Putative hydrolase n=1 Tax=Magnetofaba australis IT-1 TaxID=1434232 RepID=A0A1Y2K3N5_9PROT|nr:HAD family hydrolase [Magnetofaba australis]OSM02287.1 putative hydrolase [Magnetofaba australis IT-1]